MLVLQPEVVERAASESFAVNARHELSDRDAPVERRVVVTALRDGAAQPRRPFDVRVEEARHRDPRRVAAPVRQDPVLHAPEPVVADELHTTGKAQQTTTIMDCANDSQANQLAKKAAAS